MHRPWVRARVPALAYIICAVLKEVVPISRYSYTGYVHIYKVQSTVDGVYSVMG